MLLVSGIYFLCNIILNNNSASLTTIERLIVVIAPSFVYLFFNILFQNYKSLWKYAEIEEFLFCVVVSLTAGFIYAVSYHFISGKVNLFYNILATLASALLMMFYRAAYNILSRHYANWNPKSKKRLLIVGAGSAASSLISELRKNPENGYLPICAVDDSPEKLGRYIHGIKIRGAVEDIPYLCRERKIDTIFICIPTATLEQRRRILNYCSETTAIVKILPEIYSAITNPVQLQKKMRNIRIEDMLGRNEQHFDRTEIDLYIKNKVVLVTGGGGTIGSELCRQIAVSGPQKLIIVDIFENSAYSLKIELETDFKELDVQIEIASIREADKMDELFAIYRPDIVFHAAAHKHVPLMEHNPEEAVKNNVFGTLNVVNAAEKYKVSHFVLISSDKAVNPTNIMGATKRFAEMIVQSRGDNKDTHFVAVRFGNVLGSSGSVVPLFERQIELGGPVTVTHPEITRFFMTIPEAVQLVLQAAVMAKNGEIFVLDMGEPVRIKDLAETMIRLSGLRPYKDIDIVFTGLRPGEKLYEELLMNDEGLKSTANSRIFIGKQTQVTKEEIDRKCELLLNALRKRDKINLMRVMQLVVPTYQPDFPKSAARPDRSEYSSKKQKSFASSAKVTREK